jgi:type I restriction-modification system DNA methylase subunit
VFAMAKGIDKNRNYKQRFMKGFHMLTGAKSLYTVWSDLMLLYSIEIANTATRPLKDNEPFKEIWQEREEQYIRTIKTYNKKEQKIICQMFTMLVLELEKNPNQDLLGELYMTLGISNNYAGQFFTPYSVCELMSGVITNKKQLAKEVHNKGYVNINDCACGAGATLISASEQCKEMFKKYNYQNHVYFVGQDIDITCVHMCYIQLSLHGLAGYVIHDNSLIKPEPKLPEDLEKIWFTPMWFTDVWTMRRFFHAQDILGR